MTLKCTLLVLLMRLPKIFLEISEVLALICIVWTLLGQLFICKGLYFLQSAAPPLMTPVSPNNPFEEPESTNPFENDMDEEVAEGELISPQEVEVEK